MSRPARGETAHSEERGRCMLQQDIEKIKQAFGDREFTGKQAADVLGLNAKQHSGALVNHLKGMRIAYKTANGWRFGPQPQSHQTPEAPVKAESTPITSELISTPPLTRIGDYLMFHERVILIADTARQDGS